MLQSIYLLIMGMILGAAAGQMIGTVFALEDATCGSLTECAHTTCKTALMCTGGTVIGAVGGTAMAAGYNAIESELRDEFF